LLVVASKNLKEEKESQNLLFQGLFLQFTFLTPKQHSSLILHLNAGRLPSKRHTATNQR
jgi:hypothetical protein